VLPEERGLAYVVYTPWAGGQVRADSSKVSRLAGVVDRPVASGLATTDGSQGGYAWISLTVSCRRLDDLK
jgi:hypothetical protein